jgi:hypothetical protein
MQREFKFLAGARTKTMTKPKLLLKISSLLDRTGKKVPAYFYFDLWGNRIWNNILEWSQSSSVSIVSGYALDDRAIEVRSRPETKDFSSILCVQTGSGVHPACWTMGTGGPFPGGKARLRRDADYSPHLMSRSWVSRSYTSSLPAPL